MSYDWTDRQSSLFKDGPPLRSHEKKTKGELEKIQKR